MFVLMLDEYWLFGSDFVCTVFSVFLGPSECNIEGDAASISMFPPRQINGMIENIRFLALSISKCRLLIRCERLKETRSSHGT